MGLRDSVPACEMLDDCKTPVSHIGEKGYIYCKAHAADRQYWERCRALRPWEKRLLAEGKPVPSYRPITKAAALARRGAESTDGQLPGM